MFIALTDFIKLKMPEINIENARLYSSNYHNVDFQTNLQTIWDFDYFNGLEVLEIYTRASEGRWVVMVGTEAFILPSKSKLRELLDWIEFYDDEYRLCGQFDCINLATYEKIQFEPGIPNYCRFNF